MQVENLRSYLANIKMTVKDFAKMLECDAKYLSLIASGKRPVGKRLARDIHQATNGVISLPIAKKKEKTNNKQQDQQTPPMIE